MHLVHDVVKTGHGYIVIRRNEIPEDRKQNVLHEETLPTIGDYIDNTFDHQP